MKDGEESTANSPVGSLLAVTSQRRLTSVSAGRGGHGLADARWRGVCGPRFKRMSGAVGAVYPCKANGASSGAKGGRNGPMGRSRARAELGHGGGGGECGR